MSRTGKFAWEKLISSRVAASGRRHRRPRPSPGVELLEERSLLSAGALDTTFDSDGKLALHFGSTDEGATAVARQADGKLVVAGFKRVTSGPSGRRLTVARLDASGAFDSSFGTGGSITHVSLGSFEPRDVVVQADGKILVAGGSGLVRLNSDGALDESFDGDGVASPGLLQATSVRLLGDGKILLGGRVDGSGGADFAVVRLTSAGAVDTSFGANGTATVDFAGENDFLTDLEVATDGKIVAAGYATVTGSPNYRRDFAVARFTAGGSLDTTFDGDGKVTTDFNGYDDEIKGIVVQADGRILATGWVTAAVGYDFAVVRYAANGSLDATFDGDGKVVRVDAGTQLSYDVAVDAGGRILVAGSGSGGGFVLDRYNADGSVDTTFGASGRASTGFGGEVDAPARILVAPDGTILAAGVGYLGEATVYDFALARFQGTLYPTIASNASAVTVAEGSQATVTGTFTNLAGGVVTFTATRGAVTYNAANGTWSWSYTPADGPGDTGPVTITLTNAENNVASVTFGVTVNNVAPAVSISGAAGVAEGETYTLNLSATDPGADTVTGWIIHWGDGTTSNVQGNQPSYNHEYGDNGTYVITAWAIDEDGTWAAAQSVTVGVSQSLPSVTQLVLGGTLLINGEINEGGTITVAGLIVDLGLLDTHTVSINWGDGDTSDANVSQLLNTFSATHTYTDGGVGGTVRTVTVTVTDDDGGVGTGSSSVKVLDVAPTMSIDGSLAVDGAGAVGEGAPYVLTLGTYNDVAGDAVTSYVINWGDGETTTVAAAALPSDRKVSHVYADGASGGTSRAISVTVNNDDGAFVVAGKTITVNNVVPTVSALSGPAAAASGRVITVTASASDAGGAADPLDYAWAVYKDNVLTTLGKSGADMKRFDFRAGGAGTYRVELTVTDGDNGSVAATPLTIAVTAADLIGYQQNKWTVGVSTGSAFATPVHTTWGSSASTVLAQGDFNGDGGTDVLRFEDGTWRVGVGAAMSFGNAVWANWGSGAWQNVTAGDVNGDGLTDVMARLGGEWWVSLSTGSGFAAKTKWATWSSIDWQNVSLADLTGDGKADLLARTGGQWWAAVSGSVADVPQFVGTSLWASWNSLAWDVQLLDANGDGRTDVLGRIGGEWYVGIARDKPNAPGQFDFSTSLWATWSNISWVDARVGDFDGDGKGDIAARTGGQWYVAKSNGSAFTGAALWANWNNLAWLDVRVGDFTGDGKDDIAARYGAAWWVAASSGTAFSTSSWGSWENVTYDRVFVGNAATASGGTSGFRIAPASQPNAVAVRTTTSDDLAALFWSRAAKDDDFARGLLAASA